MQKEEWLELHERFSRLAQQSNENLSTFIKSDEEAITMLDGMCIRIMWEWAESGSNPNVIPSDDPEEFLIMKKLGITIDPSIITRSILSQKFMDKENKWLRKQS